LAYIRAKDTRFTTSFPLFNVDSVSEISTVDHLINEERFDDTKK